MIITPIPSGSAINAAQGQFVTARARFQANEDLTGKTIRFNPALYFPTEATFPSNNMFSLVLPSVGVTTAMTLDADDANQNYKATLKCINAYTFEVSYSFFVVPDQGGFLPDAVMLNNTFSEVGSFEGVSLAMYVSIGKASATTTYALNVKPWSNGNMSAKFYFGDLETSGYNFLSDMTIRLESKKQISQQCYYGFYKKSDIANTTDIVNDLGMNYVRATNVKNAVASADAVDLPNSSILTAEGFTTSGDIGGLTTAEITIEGDDMRNGTYVLYVVYNLNGEWQSSQFEIEKGKVIECVSGDITVTAVDFDGRSLVADQIIGLSQYKPVTVTVAMDKTSFNARMTALGYTGTYNDVFVQVVSDVNGTLNALNDTFTFVYDPNGSSGTTNIDVTFMFTIDGVSHNITKEIQLVFGVEQTDIQGDTQDSGLNEVTVLCSEVADTYTFVPDVVQTFDGIVSNLNGGLYNLDLVNSSLELNTSGLQEDDEVCVILIKANATDLGNCACEECPSISSRVFVSSGSNPAERTITVEIKSNDNPQGAIVLTESVSGVTTTVGSGGTASIIVPYPQTFYNIEVRYTDTNNCTYRAFYSNALESIDTYDRTNVMDKVTEIVPDCDCPSATTCTNSFFLSITCDENTQTVTVATIDSFTSTTDTDELLYSTDGVTFQAYTVPIVGFEKVIVVRRVTFVDDCPVLYAEETVVCELYDSAAPPSVACDYSGYSLAVSYDNLNKEMNIQLTGNQSALDLNDVSFRLDEGEEIPYSDPVPVTSGFFTAYWDIQLNGCEAVRLVAYSEVPTSPNIGYQLFANSSDSTPTITDFTLPNPASVSEAEITRRLALYVNGIRYYYRAVPTQTNHFTITDAVAGDITINDTISGDDLLFILTE